MIMKQPLGQVTFSLMCLLLFFISLNDAKPEVDYSASESNILSLMAHYGYQQKIAMHREQSDQYLVVTMLTADELKEAKDWNQDNLLALKNYRLKIYMNKKVADPIETELEGETRHGEISFIYFEVDNSVDVLIKKLPVKGNNGLPYLILYSYYMPCAGISSCNFNCAEELGKFASLHRIKMRTIVGFSAVFHATEEHSSEVFMKEGGISIFRDISENFENFKAVQVMIDTNGKPMKGTFQDVFRQCLIESPVSGCIPDQKKERIVIAFINYIMLPSFIASRHFGKLSTMSKTSLHYTIETKIQESIERVSCDKMKRNPEHCIFLITKCLESALRQTERLAYPTFGAIRHDKPLEDNVIWQEAEALSRRFYSVHDFVEVPDCENISCSITSLCLSEAGDSGRTGRKFNTEERNRLTGASAASRKRGRSQETQSASKRINLKQY